MAKINISFGGIDYLIEESALDAAVANLKTHLSTVMNGSGATINFDGVPYSVDATKLSNATNNFVSYLGTISGSGAKVIVNGVEYSMDSTKLNNAITEMHNTLNNLQTEGDGTSFQIYYEKPYYWLNSVDNGWYYFIFHEDASYETYTDDNQLIGYSNGDAFYEATNDGTNLIASNDNYVIGTFSSDGTIFIMNAKDEMTCYVNDVNSSPLHFGVEYIGEVVLEGINAEASVIFNKDGSFISYLNGEVYINCPAGSVFYSGTNVIDMTNGEIIGTVSIDGNTAHTSGFTLTLSGNSSCPIRFGEIYSAYNAESNKYLTMIFYENGEAAQYVNGELEMGYRLIYEGNTIIDNILNKGEVMGTVSLDGKQITLTNGIILTLQESASSGLNEYGFYFGRKYSAIESTGDKVSVVFYENGSNRAYLNNVLMENTDMSAGSYEYGNHTITLIDTNFPQTFIVSEDGTQIEGKGYTFILEPEITYYGNALTGEYYETMPETVSDYDCYLSGDYVYLYQENLNGWVALLADIATLNQAQSQGVPLECPADFSLTSRICPVYSDILESINGVPVAILSLTFANCSNMVTAPTIPVSVMILEGNYQGCTSLMNITYAGTMEQWNNVSKENGWNTGVPATQVVCSDGVVAL